jgi:hypothetical protein
MLEIYNEAILDLLSNGNSSSSSSGSSSSNSSSSSSNSGKDGKDGREKLEVRQTPEGNHVVGLTEIQVSEATVGTALGCHYLCYLSLRSSSSIIIINDFISTTNHYHYHSDHSYTYIHTYMCSRV